MSDIQSCEKCIINDRMLPTTNGTQQKIHKKITLLSRKIKLNFIILKGRWMIKSAILQNICTCNFSIYEESKKFAVN